jgi:3-isopropylmalate/(R)-2-methylmalate dehydratase small subunit
MQAFVKVGGPIAPLSAKNIDTDVIMPKQFLKGIDRSGLGNGLFYHLRFDEQGVERPEFILNRSEWRGATFLVAGANFGCGSSREHAVWGLMEFGIRCVIAESFGGIFFDNCARNGLLAIELDADAVQSLMALAASPTTNRLTVDLERQVISGYGVETAFEIDPNRKQSLLKGLDAVGQTLQFANEIQAFEQNHFLDSPWLAT